MNGIAPKLPLTLSTEDGPYTLTKTLKETVRQNFKNLMLTIPGERMMDPTFGVGLTRYLFEQDDFTLRERIRIKIDEQLRKYMPFVKIQKLSFNDPKKIDTISGNLNVLSMQIFYLIEPINQTDVLAINSDLN